MYFIKNLLYFQSCVFIISVIYETSIPFKEMVGMNTSCWHELLLWYEKSTTYIK